MKRTKLHPPKYEPTPAEIRAACLEIQEGWSEEQEIGRRDRKNPPVEIRETRIEVTE